MAGFTLVETIVFIAIFTLALLAVTSAITYFYQTNRYLLQQAVAVTNARAGVEHLVRDLREAAFSDDGTYVLVGAATSTVTFYSDVDRDNSVEKIRYFLDNSMFKRGIINATGSPPVYNSGDESISTIAQYVRNGTSTSVFQFFDTGGTEIVNPTNVTSIMRVTATLIIDVDLSKSPSAVTLSSSATLRNVRNAQ